MINFNNFPSSVPFKPSMSTTSTIASTNSLAFDRPHSLIERDRNFEYAKYFKSKSSSMLRTFSAIYDSSHVYMRRCLVFLWRTKHQIPRFLDNVSVGRLISSSCARFHQKSSSAITNQTPILISNEVMCVWLISFDTVIWTSCTSHCQIAN